MEGWPRTNRALIYAGAFSLALLCGLLASFSYERTLQRGRVVRGVLLDGRSVAGLERPQLELSLVGPKKDVERATIELVLQEKKRKFSAKELGLMLDVEGVARGALAAGQRGSLVAQFGYFLARLVSNDELSLRYSVDHQKLQKTLGPWAKESLLEPVLPSVTYEDELIVERGRGGTVIEYAQLAELLKSSARSGELDEVKVPTRERPPLVPESEVNRVRGEAETLLKDAIEVVAPDEERTVTLSSRALGAALGSRVDEDQGKLSLQLSLVSLRKSLKKLLEAVEKDPVEATFQFSSKGEPSIAPSENGRVLDEDAMLNALLEVARGGARRVNLPLRVQEPNLTTEEAEKLGVKGLVMSFTTRHACCQPRVQNIHHAAARLDGVVLRPGEKFSLNEFLGPRRAATGYQKAPTIVRGEMEDVYGGGISQLATTLFNAVLRGGYEIIQRQPHSVYFSRYPEGHEATVSFPEPDLIFRNDTEAGMVIKTQAESTYIRVLIFGDNGGRITTVDKGKRYDIVEPPKEYEPDEDMPPEKMKRLRAGQLGWKVLVSRKVKFPNGEVKEEKREVVYNPRPELLRVHPCVIPEGEEGHTGEECPEPEIIEEEEELSEDVYYETL